jgi:putative membrane protein
MSSKSIVIVTPQGQEASVSWFEGTTGTEIRAAIAACAGLSPGMPFNLTTASGDSGEATVVVVSPSMPDRSRFNVVQYASPGIRRRVGRASSSSTPVERDGVVALFSEGGAESRSEQADIPLMSVGMPDEFANGDTEWSNILKFERISSHLSNERTWLAWVRTTVAILGLSLAYLKLQDWAGDKSMSVYTIGSLISGAGLLTFALGADRYYKVKHALETRQPEASFHRLGIWGLVLIFVFIFVGTAVSYWVLAEPGSRRGQHRPFPNRPLPHPPPT